MYAHQVIEDLQEIINSYRGLGPDVSCTLRPIAAPQVDRTEAKLQLVLNDYKTTIKAIRQSQHFHTDEFHIIYDAFKQFENTHMFMQNSEYLRLPYSVCWFDYSYELQKGERLDPGMVACPKRGILAQELKFKNNKRVLHVWLFAYTKVIDRWLMEPQAYYICVGEMFSKAHPFVLMLKEAQPNFNFSREDMGNVWPVPLMEMSFDTTKNY